MSFYLKRKLWDQEQKKRLQRIGNILSGPVIKGVRHIKTKEEKLESLKPKNRQDYERQFSKNRGNEEWKKNW